MKNFGFRKLMIFIILSATVAIAYQLPYLRYTFYDQMIDVLSLNNTQLAFIGTAVSIMSVICYPIGGILANRYSTRNLIIITLAAFVGLTVWFAFTTNYIMLVVIHFLYGFFGIATLWSAYLNGIRNLGTPETQSTLFGSSEATRGIIQTIFGFVFLGIVGAIAAPAVGFKTMLLVGAAITAVFLVLAIIFLPKEEKNDVETVEAEEKFSLKDVLTNKGVWIVTLLLAGGYTTWSVGNGYLTTYTVQVLGISDSLASALGIVRSYIIVFLAGFIGGWLLDKFSYKGKGLFILFCIIIGCILGVMFTSAVMPICVAMTLVIAFFANVIKATYWSTMEQAGIPAKMTALATGIISFIGFMPDLIITMLCGILLDNATAAGNVAAGFTQIFMILIAFAVLGIVASIMLMKRTKALEKTGAAE
ncbi:MAG: MFS transporter [Firmicutes bacterium]|nr:MFS transporter [Bacillota bacterium]